jgi:endonuclease/exonuclease/phosphatase family metal-dependent hydrolase
MKVLTCNVRCLTAKDGPNQWQYRKELCCGILRAQAPEIFCCQEMSAQHHADLAAAFPEYDSYGLADAATGRNPTNAIFFRREAFTRLSAGGYWLSEQPHVPGSKSWDSNCVRLANWVRLVERASGVEFRVVNTHLDHLGQTARENQARIVNEDALAYPADYPQILTGDMNVDATNAVIGLFQSAGWADTYGAIHGPADPGHTFHQFLGPGYKARDGKIDWIFTRGHIRATAAAVIRDCQGERFPSDHYFVSATVALGRPG